MLIFDIFKGQTTVTANKLLEDDHYLVQHVPNNHTNLFQPLDISVNEGAKSFLSNKCQDWYANKVSKQSERGVEPHDVKLDVTLAKLKLMHAGWIMDYHKEMQPSGSVVKNDFSKAKMLEAFKEADTQ